MRYTYWREVAMEWLQWLAVLEWFDWAIVILVLLYTWQGWERGMYLVVPEVVSWFLAWVVGLWGAQGVADFMVQYLGLWKEGAWLWAFIFMVVVVEQLVYRAGMQLFGTASKQSFSTFWQAFFGLIPSMLSGVMVMAFLIYVLFASGIAYPFKKAIDESRFGSTVMELVSDYRR